MVRFLSFTPSLHLSLHSWHKNRVQYTSENARDTLKFNGIASVFLYELLLIELLIFVRSVLERIKRRCVVAIVGLDKETLELYLGILKRV